MRNSFRKTDARWIAVAAITTVLVLALGVASATQVPIVITTNAQIMTEEGATQQQEGGVAAQNQTETTSMTDTTFTAQKTATSVVDSLPGHQLHQAVVVLPQRTDGMVWVGTLSWSSS